MKYFSGKIYNDGERLKIVFDKQLQSGRQTITITKVNGLRANLSLEVTITNNDPYHSKTRIPPLPGLKPGSMVEGYVDDEIRCHGCGRRCTSTINDFCDDCYIYINFPQKPLPERAGEG